ADGAACEDPLGAPVAALPGRDVVEHAGELSAEGGPHEGALIGAEPLPLPAAVGAGDVPARLPLPVAVLDAVALFEVAPDVLEDRQPGQPQEVPLLLGC